MPTKLEGGSLFLMTDNGPVPIMQDCVEWSSIEASPQDETITTGWNNENSVEFTCMAPLWAKVGRRIITQNQALEYLGGYSNNWRKMHKMPKVRSVALRPRRRRSKSKKDKMPIMLECSYSSENYSEKNLKANFVKE